jgi:Ni/Co efflux regulator RcnB
VDWHREHLREPPAGYEWVDTGGQFVLVAIASGVIADILIHAAQ